MRPPLQVAYAALAGVALAIVIASCEDPVSTPQDIAAASAQVLGHFHRATISGNDIANPPSSGKEITTTSDHNHTHRVRLSQQQLIDLQQNGAVLSIVSESAADPTMSNQTHDHLFVFEQ
jgi:hypothetical protein